MNTPDEPRAIGEGIRTFQTTADAYDRFMGRYSRLLAPRFAQLCLDENTERALDVGCGPGALTAAFVDQLGSDRVASVDPVEGFVTACAQRHPGVDVRRAPAERLPFGDSEFGCAAAQLVFHFVSDARAAAVEMIRVVRPGGVVAAAVWDFAEEMEMLRAFWDAALSLDPQAPDEARTLRFGSHGELSSLFRDVGLSDVEEGTLSVTSTYQDFEELWAGFGAGIGPAGAYLVARGPGHQNRLRDALWLRLGKPNGPFDLRGVARTARGVVIGKSGDLHSPR